MRIVSVVLCACIFSASALLVSSAQTVDELRENISDTQENIEKLEAEIAQYEKELDGISKEKRTLESTVRELDTSRKKVQTSISLTTRRIQSTEQTIGTLSNDIKTRETLLSEHAEALAESIRRMNEQDEETLIEVLLGGGTVGEAWENIESIRQFKRGVEARVAILNQEKQRLETTRAETEKQQSLLSNQQQELAQEKYALDLNRSAKNSLLSQTKNKESTYQELLEEKRAAKIEFEKALNDFESELSYVLNPSTLPPAGKGVLRWPLANVHVTQYFGNTSFAQSGAYNGQGHNGVDFRASVGTPIKSALSGTVVETGNTDAHKGCYSYGKWVLVKHGNGLTTLYAHLSDIRVSSGQSVTTGDLLGYSGNTGYSTGPHLHFSVYASEAVSVQRLGDVKAKTNCANARIPVSATSGYLNPLDYL